MYGPLLRVLVDDSKVLGAATLGAWAIVNDPAHAPSPHPDGLVLPLLVMSLVGHQYLTVPMGGSLAFHGVLVQNILMIAERGRQQ